MTEEQIQRLWAIAARFRAGANLGLLARSLPPFNVSKPNLHDTKSDFLAEKQAIADAIGAAQHLMGFFDEISKGPVTEKHIPLASILDYHATVKYQNISAHSAFDIVRCGAREMGFGRALRGLLRDYEEVLADRQQELVEQEAEFWTAHGRAPDHFARTIALRFARWIARETGQRPTFGTSSQGGHPSTEFGRALEEIFEILGIQATVRHPATWAIDQLTEEDFGPYKTEIGQNALARLAQGIGSGVEESGEQD